MKMRLNRSNSGYSLIELLVVIGILSIIMTLTGIALLGSNTIPVLETEAKKVEGLLNLARKKAISTGNQWIFHVDLANQTYEIANDDGWLGTLTAPNASSEPRVYYNGNPDFDLSRRNNGSIDMNERVQGPFALQQGVRFVDDSGANMNSDLTIVFNNRGRVSGVQIIWLADRNYPRPFPYSPTHDQRLHRRKLTVFPAGMIKMAN